MPKNIKIHRCSNGNLHKENKPAHILKCFH